MNYRLTNPPKKKTVNYIVFLECILQLSVQDKGNKHVVDRLNSKTAETR